MAKVKTIEQEQQVAVSQAVAVVDDFDTGSYVGTTKTALNVKVLQFRNPYAGNPDEIASGGFAIPLEQVPTPDLLFQIGPEAEITPLDPTKKYKAFVSKEVEIGVLGWTDQYNTTDQGKYLKAHGVDSNAPVLVTRQWVPLLDEKGKSLCVSNRKLYFVFKNDPRRDIYSLNLTSTSTQAMYDIIKQVQAIQNEYARLATIAKGVPQPIPGPFILWIKLIPGPKKAATSKSGESSTTRPPVVYFDSYPVEFEDYIKHRVSKEDYVSLGNLAKAVDEFLASDFAPHKVSTAFHPEVTALSGLSLVDGKVTKAASVKPFNDNDLMIKEYIAKNGEAAFWAFLEGKGITKDAVLDLMANMGVNKIENFDTKVSSLISALKD